MGDVVMNDKISIMGIELDCLTAKEAMLRIMGFLENESVDTIEVLSMDVLMAGRDDTEWKKLIEQLEMVVPGDVEILNALDVDDRIKIKEAQNKVFQKLFIKYLEKNKRKIFLLGTADQDIENCEKTIRRYAKKLRIIGHGVLNVDGNTEEKVINEINGTETDCIFSVLPSPYQEEFIVRNRALMNTKIWFGCSVLAQGGEEKKSGLQKMRHFFVKRMFFHQAEKRKD